MYKGELFVALHFGHMQASHYKFKATIAFKHYENFCLVNYFDEIKPQNRIGMHSEREGIKTGGGKKKTETEI